MQPLALGQEADEPLARLRERDDGRHGPAALGGRDDRGLAALHDGDDGVRRAEVDADDLAHGWFSLLARDWGQLMGSWLEGPSGAAATATGPACRGGA